MAGEKKNNKVNWMVSNSAKLDRRTKQHTQFGVSASNGSRDMARTKLWQKKRKKEKKKKNNEANWMVSNSAKLDRRTKQHTQFGVSASNGSRDMARTKVAEKKMNVDNPIKHPLRGSLIRRRQRKAKDTKRRKTDSLAYPWTTVSSLRPQGFEERK